MKLFDQTNRAHPDVIPRGSTSTECAAMTPVTERPGVVSRHVLIDAPTDGPRSITNPRVSTAALLYGAGVKDRGVVTSGRRID